jgi:hypothetical protein
VPTPAPPGSPWAIQVVHIDAQVRDRSLVDRRVDAISAYAFHDPAPQVAGWPFYALQQRGYEDVLAGFATQRQRLKEDPGVVSVHRQGHEAVVWTINHPDEALKVFLELKELGMTSSGREFTARLGITPMTW